MMKVRFHSHGILPILLLLLLAFILSVHTARPSHLLAGPKQGREGVKIHDFSEVGQAGESEGSDDSWNLMGLEGCTDGDAECMKRRMLSEAHLDYIYTQHLVP